MWQHLCTPNQLGKAQPSENPLHGSLQGCLTSLVNKRPHVPHLKYIIIIVVLAVLACVCVLGLRPSAKQRAADAVYAKLKALPPVAKDFTTPEGAILCLEDAYRHRDIEAAVACKAFTVEARLMLQNVRGGEESDESLIKKTADVLELGYRKEISTAWPDFAGLESFFTGRELHSDKIVVVTEMCRFPDGLFSQQRILVTETPKGWRVLNPESK